MQLIMYLEVLELKIYSDKLLALFANSFTAKAKILICSAILFSLLSELESLIISFFTT